MHRVAESIPDELRDFLREVSAEINAHSESAQIPSDDLLQCECAYGGLLHDDPNYFFFTYFPEEDTLSKWELRLSATDIHAVAESEIGTLVFWKCELERCPNRFANEDGHCDYCNFWNQAAVSRPSTEEENTCTTSDDWILLFSRKNPWATGREAYDAYQHTPGLESRLGPLPTSLIHQGRLG